MERRVLLFIFLSLVILYGFQALFVPPPPPATEGAPPAVAVEGSGSTAAPSPAAPVEPAAPPAPAAESLVGETAEREIRVETDHVIAVFTNRGGRLRSWQLKRYFERGELLQLVPQNLDTSHPLPFSLSVDDEAVTRTLNGSIYAVKETPASGSNTPGELTFEYRDASGLDVVKTFRFEAPYVVAVRATVAVGDKALAPAVQWGPALAGAAAATSYAVGAAGLIFVNGELERLDPADIASQSVRQGDFGYAGVDEHYFMTAAIRPGPSEVAFRAVAAPPAEGSGEEARNLVAYAIEPAAQDRPLLFFAGPKDFDILAALDRDLVRAIDFGIFAFLVVPLLRSLNWIHDFVGNYGWSIVLLTVVINALMFPLRHKSVVSMRKMQEIQPEAKAIQERYAKLKATDPAKQKMNQELMGLYRERGVNPASGCVPMLLTLPVLLAFYSLLTVAIELRGAPFVAWINDLSAPDPYYVTPVLMGLTQMWQTWMTPQTGVDPAQQKLMMFMPVMFMVFFLWAPAGVVLYWFVSNLWGIGQTYLTNYLIGPPKVHHVRPPAERRMKRAGAGKTEAATRES